MTLPYRQCTVPGCDKPLYAKGLCEMHRSRMKRYGSLELPKSKPLEERFWPKVKKGDGCWLWQGGFFANGYPRFHIKTKSFLAHRIAYELTYGPIHDGINICHECDNPPCVRPAHLFQGTQQDNVVDMWSKERAGFQKNGIPKQKLSDDDVRDIRRRVEVGEDKLEIAAIYDIHWSTVYSIASRRYRASVE